MSAADLLPVDPALAFERAYVATVVAMPKAYDANRISPDDIGSAALRGILEATLAVHVSSPRVTRAAIRAELDRTGRAKLIGALDTLGDIEPDLAPVAARIRDHATVRRLRADAQRLTNALARADVAGAREAIAALSMAHDAANELDPVMTFGELLGHGIEELKRAWDADNVNARACSVQLAFPASPDLRTEGTKILLTPGRTLTLGAQTNVGKSGTLLTWFIEASRRGVACGIISVEDPLADWATRSLGEMSGVNPSKMWENRLTREDWLRLSEAATANSANPISTAFVRDRSLDGVLARMEFMARVRGCRVIAVDYLQAISHRSGKDIRERIDRTLEELIAQAGRLGVALILASQLSRPDKGNPFREPNLIDLKESGSIENRSQTVVLLWRENDMPGALVRGKVAKVKRQVIGARFALGRTAEGRIVETSVPAPTSSQGRKPARPMDFGGDDE